MKIEDYSMASFEVSCRVINEYEKKHCNIYNVSSMRLFQLCENADAALGHLTQDEYDSCFMTNTLPFNAMVAKSIATRDNAVVPVSKEAARKMLSSLLDEINDSANLIRGESSPEEIVAFIAELQHDLDTAELDEDYKHTLRGMISSLEKLIDDDTKNK